jgi:hypothetical protein
VVDCLEGWIGRRANPAGLGAPRALTKAFGSSPFLADWLADWVVDFYFRPLCGGIGRFKWSNDGIYAGFLAQNEESRRSKRFQSHASNSILEREHNVTNQQARTRVTVGLAIILTQIPCTAVVLRGQERIRKEAAVAMAKNVERDYKGGERKGSSRAIAWSYRSPVSNPADIEESAIDHE